MISKRKLNMLIFTGVLILTILPSAFAQDVPKITPTKETAEVVEAAKITINDVTKEAIDAVQINLNIAWVCVAAFLVFFMQAGFAMVETGFTRAKNACNIMMKNLMDFSMGTIMWFLVGFAFMFAGGNALIGYGDFFAGNGITDSSFDGLGWSFWIFQCVFAGTAATIVSGAMAGRTKFKGYLAYSAIICGIIYPVSGHWIWGGGWLSEMGFHDFAGSTVVHSCGAWLALAGAIVLGPRIGKYGPDKKSKPILGHNIPLAALGVFILWFGWFGFNPGSEVAADSAIGYIALTTNLAAAAGAIAAMATIWIKGGKPDVSMSLNGVLAGLVAITAGCDYVSPLGAIIIGAMAGVLVVLSVEFIDKVLKIDDPVGAVSVHGACGAFGTIALVFFPKAGADPVSPLTQLTGVAAVFGWSFFLGLALFLTIKYTIGLRASEEEEMQGLDITEHGNEAYSGFQIFINH